MMDNDYASPIMGILDHVIAVTNLPDEQVVSEELPEKISAYYSLAFPNFTYYVQTISVTIGRRSVRPGTPSSSDVPQVDVDLGNLKSVSRLHARIEYEESQERFVLVVLGRNGAWVDGVWSGSGSRVPLRVRSQIQIATRVFHFILPPPPAPEDSPSPSSPSSTTRHLSPSIDITSLSPDSSIHSPSIKDVELPPADAVGKGSPGPHENGKTAAKASGKKRKKPGDGRPPPPEVMPPRPQMTYAQLCYRAITALNGKATLQEICIWVSENFDWYRYNEGTGWESSIRHNLSSNRAFKKMERCAGERGKGFFWSVDPRFEHIVKDQEGKGNGDGIKGKGKNSKLLEPPLKRSVKGDSSSPLPPPLSASLPPAFTNTPLTSNPVTTPPNPSPAQAHPASSTIVSPAIKVELEAVSLAPAATALPQLKPEPVSATSGQQQIDSRGTLNAGTNSEANASMPTIPSDIVIPIVIGSVPPAGPSDARSSSKAPHVLDPSSPPIALHRDTIILNPAIFSSLTAEQLKELEALGAKKAIEILQSYIVRFLREKRKTDSSKSKGKKKKGSKKKDGKEETTSGAEAATLGGAGHSRASSPSLKALSPTSEIIQAIGPLHISTPCSAEDIERVWKKRRVDNA